MAMTTEDPGHVLRAIVDALPTPTLVVDSRGCIEMLNAEALELVGYSSGDLAGCPVETLVPERHQNAHAKLVRSFYGHPSKRAMGVGRELSIRR
jgi:PAS domain S-box-containing protein